MKSRWQDLFAHLEKEGFEVYPPANKIGKCTSNYIVIKNDGAIQHGSFSTIDDFYNIMCYVPLNKYSELEVFVQSVKLAMKKIEPMFLPTFEQTPSFYEEENSSHMISITYKNYKKNL